MSYEPPVEPPTSERHARDTFRIRILDKPEHVDRLKDACQDAGHSVVGAHTIEEAFAFLDGQDHADVIVCAAHMEDESMFEFLRRVRDDEQHKNVMILMLALESGPIGIQTSASTERAGRALGADAYITMPTFDAVALIDAIEKLLPEVPNLEQEKQADLKRERDRGSDDA